MKCFGFVPFLVLMFAACQDTPTAVQNPNTIAPRLSEQAITQITNLSYPVNETVWVPCVDENVAFTGEFHDIVRGTWTGNNFSMTYHGNAQGIIGTGLTSGDTYRSVAAPPPGPGPEPTRSSVHNGIVGSFVNGVWQGTAVYQFLLIGEGSAKNFMVRYTANLTTNANGDVTAYHDYLDRLMVECR